MYVVHARNVNDAYAKGLRYLREKGERQSSRAGEVLVSPQPVTTVYTCPTERVLFDPQRDANPFFHLFEALWMLSGRRDARYLDRFVKDFSSRFAEEDGRQHGAYGYRWRRHFELEGGGVPQVWRSDLPDQLSEIVRLLRENPDDRRIVLTMWDPVADLGASKRDIPCLAGDTLVWSPEGDCSLADLERRFSSGQLYRWPVYAVDEVSKELRLTWCTRVWRSGTKRTVKLVFDGGSSMRLTIDHIVYRRGLRAVDAVPVQVKDLRAGDRILATQRWVDGKGYEFVKKYLGGGTAFSNRQKVHVAYGTLLYGAPGKGRVFHHKNDVKLDNAGSNLELVSESWYNSYHRLGDRNPMRNLTPAQHAARAHKQSAALKRSWAALTVEQRRNRARGLPLDNHRIVAIEQGLFEPVYDFEVPGQHTALVGTGVVVHNCNTHVYFRVCKIDKTWAEHAQYTDGIDIREVPARVLDMTVCCRSNDAIWGAYGANAVHFSVLQEYMAAAIGVNVGTYYQVSNNFHAYVDAMVKVGFAPALARVSYGAEGMIQLPIVTVSEFFLEDLDAFMAWTDGATRPAAYLNGWFATTAEPMYRAHKLWKHGDYTKALDTLLHVKALDWRVAAQGWMERRVAQMVEKANVGK